MLTTHCQASAANKPYMQLSTKPRLRSPRVQRFRTPSVQLQLQGGSGTAKRSRNPNANSSMLTRCQQTVFAKKRRTRYRCAVFIGA